MEPYSIAICNALLDDPPFAMSLSAYRAQPRLSPELIPKCATPEFLRLPIY